VKTKPGLAQLNTGCIFV